MDAYSGMKAAGLERPRSRSTALRMRSGEWRMGPTGTSWACPGVPSTHTQLEGQPAAL